DARHQLIKIETARRADRTGSTPERLLELAALALALAHELGRIVGADAQRLRDLAKQPVVIAQQPHRLGPGQRLDPPDVRRARRLGDDPKWADLGGETDVRAAAQLA